MEDELASPWFYTREGEKIGPVSLTDLRIAAQEGRLNPRLDMVWTKGMDTWLPAGEIDGLFERRADAVEEKPAAVVPGTQPHEPQEIELDKDSGWPGAGRAVYILVPVVFSLLWGAGLVFGLPLLKPQVGPEAFTWIALLAPWVPSLVVLSLILSRFRNLGMSRWWILGMFVPLLNLWVGYRLFACPPGYPWHKKMDGVGWFLAVVYWLFNLLLIAAFAISIGVIAGAVGNPELRQKFQDLIRQMEEKQKQIQQQAAPAPLPTQPTAPQQ